MLGSVPVAEAPFVLNPCVVGRVVEAPGTDHLQCLRQQRVQGAGQPADRDPVETEVDHLAQRVGARVGAAGRGHVDLGAAQLAECSPQLALDGPASRLALPAGETGAVVLEHDLDIQL